MNNKLYNLAKMICILSIVLASISCNTRNTEKTNNLGNIVLDFKNDSLAYKVYENHSKISSNNIDQCEKFLEYKNSPDSFEIYGGDIADLFAIFFDKKRNNVRLNNKAAVFYTIKYNGIQNDSVKKDIINYLLNKRELKVLETTEEVNAYEISIGRTDKIAKHISNKNIEEGGRYALTDDNYELTNVNLTILVNALNELYPNSFFTKNNDVTKYNLKVSLGKNIDSIITYLNNNYGIESNPGTKKIDIYHINNND